MVEDHLLYSESNRFVFERLNDTHILVKTMMEQHEMYCVLAVIYLCHRFVKSVPQPTHTCFAPYHR